MQKIYVMENPYRKLVKIGISKDPKRRLSVIRSVSGEPMIRLIEVFDVKPLIASTVERRVHNSLCSKWVYGEWFDCTPGEAIKTIQIACGGNRSCLSTINEPYYEGYPCLKCKNVLRYKSNRGCVFCTRNRSAEWRQNNITAHRKQQTSYRRRKKYERETPRWADLQAIEEIYKQCDSLSETMGMNLHVIHEIPINGKNVCGLHIAENLKVVSESWIRIREASFNPKRF